MYSGLPIFHLADAFPEHFEAPSLESLKGKLGWAKKHLETLRDELAPHERSGAHSITAEHDADTSEYIFKVRGIAEAKPEWGYIAGDCLHNLRSALDQLVLQLARLSQGGRRLTEAEVHSCAFPVFSEPSDFKKRGEGRIALLRTGEQARIREVQPFNARDMSIWGTEPEVLSPSRAYPANLPGLLSEITLLDNIDKHRGVHVAWRSVCWYATIEPPEPFRQSSVSAAALIDDAEIGGWRYDGAKPELPSDMDMDRYLPVRVAIGHPHGVWGYGVVDLLGWCVAATEMVIDWFEPCFRRGDPVLPLADIDAPFMHWADINWLKTQD